MILYIVFGVVYITLIGMTYRSVKEIWVQGPERFFKDNVWNVLEGFQLALYWIFIAMSIVAYVQVK